MFGELPKLFDRDFAIGFFLPAAAFISALLVLKAAFFPSLLPGLGLGTLAGAGGLGLAALAVAVALLLLNRSLYRLLLGPRPPSHGTARKSAWGRGLRRWANMREALWVWWQRRELARYRELHEDLRRTREECHQSMDECGSIPAPLQQRLDALTGRAADEFPDDEARVLPTRLGNVTEAFMAHSRVLYGAASTSIWSRLWGVVPKDQRAAVDGAKAHVDFWVNAGCLSFLLLIAYAGVAAYTTSLGAWGLPLAAALLLWIAPGHWVGAAQSWGEEVSACADLFLPDLYAKLGLPAAETREEQRRQWGAFSQAISFRDFRSLPELKPPPAPDRPGDAAAE